MRTVVSEVHELFGGATGGRVGLCPSGSTAAPARRPGRFHLQCRRTNGTVTSDPEGAARLPASARSETGSRPKLREIPDARLTFDDSEFGSAGIQQHPDQRDRRSLEAAGLELERQMRTLIPGIADPRPSRRRAAPRWSSGPRPTRPRASASSVADHRGRGARRHGRRHRRQCRQAERGRAAHPDPRAPAARRPRRPAAIKNLRMPTAIGGTTTLETVADVYFQAGPARSAASIASAS